MNRPIRDLMLGYRPSALSDLSPCRAVNPCETEFRHDVGLDDLPSTDNPALDAAVAQLFQAARKSRSSCRETLPMRAMGPQLA